MKAISRPAESPEGDKRYIFKAAAAASKAHRWLMDC